MMYTHDLFIERDIVPLFNNDLHADGRFLLQKILSEPLKTVSEIEERQFILKNLLLQQGLLNGYYCHKTDYAEVQRFLMLFPKDDLKKLDYLTYLVQKKKNNVLIGHYYQLVYFFRELELVLRETVDIKKFPKSFQEELHFILNYLSDFKLSRLKEKVNKQKFGYLSVQFLNELVLEKRKFGDTSAFFAKLNLLEVYISICKTIRKTDFQFPLIGTDALALKNCYHIQLKDAVKNDFVAEGNTAIITGTNMSGKSTFLKTVGLCVYLAHLGLPIPAESGSIPFYDDISIHINHSDDIKNGYSHFMNEIKNLKNVLTLCREGKTCFVIFDELFKGTNHEDALAISKMTINGLKKFHGSNFIISTHIAELEEEVQEVQALYVESELVDGRPVFTYRLQEGWSDLKIGQILFQTEGLDDILS